MRSESHGDATTLSRLVRLFCCLPPLSLVFTGFPLIASLRMIVQNGELFGIVGYTFAREVGDKVGDAPDPPL